MMNSSLLTTTWNPKQAGDRVLAGLVNVCAPQVKGAHDSDLVLVDGKAYIVYEANDVQPGEAPDWPFVYCALSVVDVASGRVEQTLTFAASEMRFGNETLPVGACFVPHVLQKDPRTIRCFFASEDFRVGHEAQTWYRDYDLTNGAYRSVFNLDVSHDGIHWERKYRFETEKSFQYPTLREYAGAIYLTVTQGDYSDSRKERIMYGKLEELGSL
jgi:hypothetical protein